MEKVTTFETAAPARRLSAQSHLNMKKTSQLFAIATLAVAFIVPVASAQEANSEARPKAERRGPGGGGRPMMEEISKELGLSEDQKDKVGAIMRARMEQGRALREDTSLSEEDRRSKMRSIMENSRKEIEALLTPEQKAKYATMQERRGGRGGPEGGKGEGRPRKGDK